MNIKDKSLTYVINHSKDSLLNRGYNYKGKIFYKTASKYMMANDKIEDILVNKFDPMVTYIIDRVKDMKRVFAYTIGRDFEKFN